MSAGAIFYVPGVRSARRRSGKRPGPEVLLVSRLECVDRIGVAQTAEMLERAGRGDAAHPRAEDIRQIEREALHQTAAVGIADSSGIDDAVRLDCLNVGVMVGG